MALAATGSGSNATANNTSAASLTVALTVASGDTGVIAAVAFSGSGVPNDNSAVTMAATCDGVSMTSIGRVHSNGVGTEGFVEVFKIANPNVGAVNVVFTPGNTGGTGFWNMEGGAQSFSGGDTTTVASLVTSTTGTSGPSASGTGTVGNVLLWAACCGIAMTAPNQTSVFAVDSGSNDSAAEACAMQYAAASGSSQTGSWTGADWYAVMLIEVLAGSGTNPTTTCVTVATGIGAATVSVTDQIGQRGIPYARLGGRRR